MKISEIVIVENINDIVNQELEDKIGTVGQRRPGWENVNTPAVLQKAKGLYTTGGPSMTAGLAVDLSIEEIHPELRDKMKKEFGYSRSGPGVDTGDLKTAFKKPSRTKSDDGEFRKGSDGRTLKHDRFYGVSDEPQQKDKKEPSIDLIKKFKDRFKDVDSIRKTKSPGKYAKATKGALGDIADKIGSIRDIAPKLKNLKKANRIR